MAMPGYGQKVLKEFHHELPRKHNALPCVYVPKRYGTGTQVMEVQEKIKDLDSARKKFIQQVTGLFYLFGKNN